MMVNNANPTKQLTVSKLTKPTAAKNQTRRKDIPIPSPREREKPPSNGTSLFSLNRGRKQKDIQKRHIIQRNTEPMPGSPRLSMKTADNIRITTDMIFIFKDAVSLRKLNLST